MQRFLSLRCLRRVVISAMASIILAQVLLGISGPPDSLVNWLDATDLKPHAQPRYIVVLGGGGMPSQSTLIRLYHAANYGRNLTNCTFVVCLPADNDPEHSSVGRMKDDLVMRGIAASAIQMETKGRNTREEAVNVAKILGPDALKEPVLIVSSDFHLRRAVLLFRKAGFCNLSALSAHTVNAEADPGPLTWIRYGLWKNEELGVCIMRELVAIAACKVLGWI